MATTTVTELVTRTISGSATASATSTNRAAAQGGIFEGRVPTHFEPKNPITLFIIQAAIVITLTRLLHWPLSKLRQPRVIAEVITGIVLGPSIMGRIPGFTQNIFPTASMPGFTLVANLGLVLFLFLVGLEVDLRYLASNWRVALSVGAAGMILPFGLGFAIAWGLYHQFHDEPNLVPISFSLFALFIGIAIAITAFPVLCRILTSLQLLSTPVGVIVLSAGVANDVVGWILLALCVALVNSGGGLTALYIFLVAVGYSLMVAYPLRWSFMWFLRRTGSLSNGPTQSVMALTLFLVLASAFFTDVIGIHAIFGAFMIGLICPHEGGFAIKITEKIEDLVSTLFLPLYFALSGLNTNLGLLDTGITWAYVIGVIAVAFFGKVIGGTAAAKLNGLLWGESLTIGFLMSCKGLVELIVLNIGLQARILSSRTFTIFVVMALVTTFATTPLTVWIYPPEYQQKVQLWKAGKIDWDGNPTAPSELGDVEEDEVKSDIVNRMVVYLRLDGLPSLFNIVSLFTGGERYRSTHGSVVAESESAQSQNDKMAAAAERVVAPSQSLASFERPLRIHGLRLMELTERDSSVMRVSEHQEYAVRDPIIKAFGVSAAAQRSSRNVTISAQIAVVPEEAFSSTLISRARDIRSDFILVPWSETGTISEHAPAMDLESTNDPLSNKQYATLATSIFNAAASVSSVGVFIDKSLVNHANISRVETGSGSPLVERSRAQLARSVTGLSLNDNHDESIMFRSTDNRGRHQIRVLYTGHADDLLAVRLALQLAKNEEVRVRVLKLDQNEEQDSSHINLEMEKARTSLPPYIASRVQWEDFATSSSDAIAPEILANKSHETGDLTVIVGRAATASRSLSSSQMLDSRDPAGQSPTNPRASLAGFNQFQPGATSTSSTQFELTRSLGGRAMSLINLMKEMSLGASLLVVQAKAHKVRDGEAADLKRAASVDSTVER